MEALKIELIPVSSIKQNPDNPRIITDNSYLKLVESLKAFPKGLEKNPLVCFHKGNEIYVLDGNMRINACVDASIPKVPVLFCDDWSEDQKKEYIIKSNVSYGEWDWEKLNFQYSFPKLDDWGLDVPAFMFDEDINNIDITSLADLETKEDPEEFAEAEAESTDAAVTIFLRFKDEAQKLRVLSWLNKINEKSSESAIMTLMTQYDNAS